MIGGGAARTGRSAADTLDTAAVERAVAASRPRRRVFMEMKPLDEKILKQFMER
jgi:hypothetical protein